MNPKTLLNFLTAILILDAVIALWRPPILLTLSNLLFIEGGFTFAAGAFLAFAASARSRNPSPGRDQRREKAVHAGLYLMLAGGVLIIFSILVGQLVVKAAT